MIRRPFVDIKDALETVYRLDEIGTKDIMRLFGASETTAREEKNRIKKKQLQADVPVWDEKKVNTEFAYEQWGYTIKDLERRYTRLKRLGVKK